MHRYIALCLISFISFSGWTQPMNLNLALLSGVSIPAFDYSAKELDKGSFAMTGFAGSFELNSTIYKNFGAFIQSGITLNPVDVGTLGYEKMQADPFLQDVYIRSDPYRVIHLIAGPGYKWKISDKMSLEGELGAGVFFSSTPYQLYKTVYFLQGPPYFEITRSKDVSFAYNGSLRLIYDVSSCYQVGLTSQLMHSKASFDFYTSTRIRTDVRNITCWNTSFSLIFKLFTIKN